MTSIKMNRETLRIVRNSLTVIIVLAVLLYLFDFSLVKVVNVPSSYANIIIAVLTATLG